MKIVQFHRRPTASQFSVEGYFARVRSSLCSHLDFRGVSGEFTVEKYEVPFHSRGILRRIVNAIACFINQGDVNHIAGDIHYVALMLSKKKTILTVLDCEILHRSKGLKKWFLRHFWYTLPSRSVACITVISSETKRKLLEQIDFPEYRIHVVPVSISPSFRPFPRFFQEQCPQILQVGTKKNKNLIRLVAALAGMDCHLHIVGALDAEQRHSLNKHGVAFTTYERLSEEELLRRYVEADIVSFVSTHEGFGMPIIEAQAVERVCITSNISSMPEVAGKGAYFVDPFDLKSIREGFERVRSDHNLRQLIIEEGRVNRKRFESDTIALEFLKLYESISIVN